MKNCDIIKNYIDAKEFISRYISSSDDCYPLFVLSTYAVYCEYDNYHDIINSIIDKTFFCIQNDSIKNIVNDEDFLSTLDNLLDKISYLILSNANYSEVILKVSLLNNYLSMFNNYKTLKK